MYKSIKVHKSLEGPYTSNQHDTMNVTKETNPELTSTVMTSTGDHKKTIEG